MKTLYALVIILTIIVSCLILLPAALAIDVARDTMNYTVKSMFVDVGVIIHDVWINRQDL